MSCLWDVVIPVAPVTLPTEVGVASSSNGVAVGQSGVVAFVSRTHLLEGAALRVGLLRAGLDDVAQRLGLNHGHSAAENVTSE